MVIAKLSKKIKITLENNRKVLMLEKGIWVFQYFRIKIATYT
jgi:hypothetical protein